MKVRQHLYLDREISDALKALAAVPDGSMSKVANDALRDWLARRGAKELDPLLKGRLDRLARDNHRIRRDVAVLLEKLTLLIRYQLNVTAPLVPDDAADRAVELALFEEFTRLVGSQLATSEPMSGDWAEEEPS